MTSWQVSVFSRSTERLLDELEARAPDRAAVRLEWGLPSGVAIGELPITDEHLSFVNALLVEPLRLLDGQVAFLGEVAEDPGEEIHD
ncbi:MAG: hypothetical protein QOH36_939 [Actinomycetota bacterium]|nr:hypothetical protein [Actinomycetota bacterium]